MKSLFLLICLTLLLTACGPSVEQQSTMTATAMTATAAAWTPTPTATNTPTSTPTPTPTNTPTPTSTLTPTPTATNTPLPTSTQDPNRFYASDGRFSMMLPTGWTAEEVGMEYPALFAPGNRDTAPNIIFMTATSDFPVEFFAAGVQDSMAQKLDNLTTVSEEFLTTPAGDNYFRWEMNFTQDGVPLHAVMYFFEDGNWKLGVTYSRLRSTGAENDALVDTAIETIQIGQ